MYLWIAHHLLRHQFARPMLDEIHKYVFSKLSQALFFAQNEICNQITEHFSHYQLHFIVVNLIRFRHDLILCFENVVFI